MRHVRKQQKSLMPKILLIVVLVAALSISSVVTVMANTADITVYDGSETYRFSMIVHLNSALRGRSEHYKTVRFYL